MVSTSVLAFFCALLSATITGHGGQNYATWRTDPGPGS